MNPVNELNTYIYDLDIGELRSLLLSWGEAPYRADQIWMGIYKNYWYTPDDFSNLSKKLKAELSENVAFSHLRQGIVQESSDGETIKTLYHLPHNEAIEAVLMRYNKRRTLCISTQAGCAMGCVFCATGQMGFLRNLTSGEIVEQVIFYARQLAKINEKVTNIVFMGMGEPFHNYENTMSAIDRLNHPDGFNFGQRRMTVSTVGLVPGIRRFAKENRQVNLAVSLHAADDELRSSMLPVNNRYPIKDVIQASKEYVEYTHRRITFEWALIHDVNDTQEQARKLAGMLKGMLCHVNVIPLNPTMGYQGKATTRERAVEFKAILTSAGIPCTIRIRRGIDIKAGCGQLASQAG